MSENQSTEKQATKKWYEPVVDWFKLYGDKSIDFILKNGGSYLATKIGGFWGVVVKYSFDWVIEPALKFWKNKIINTAKEKEKLEKFKEEIKKEQTDEERIKSDSDFLGD